MYQDSRWLNHSSALTDERHFQSLHLYSECNQIRGPHLCSSIREKERVKPITKPVHCGLVFEKEVCRGEVQVPINPLMSFPLL